MGSMAETHSKWVNGNLVFYTARRDEWIYAMGPDVKQFIEDFAQPNLDAALLQGWTNTAVEGGTGTSTHIAKTGDGKLGVLRWDAAANENDGLQSQLLCETFKLATDKPMYFGAHWAITEKTQSDAILGICITDTSVIASVSDGVYFMTNDGDANLDVVTEKDSSATTTDTGVDLVDGAFVTTEFFFDGAGTIRFYVDGTLVATHTTTIPDDEYLTATIAYLNGAATMQHDGVDVDWIRCIYLS